MLPATVEFPAKQTQLAETVAPVEHHEEEPLKEEIQEITEEIQATETPQEVETATPVAPDALTPLTSQAPSEAESTQPTTPSSTAGPTSSAPPPARPQTASNPARNPRPVVPVVPILPQTPATTKHPRQDSVDGSTATKTATTTKEIESLAADIQVASPESEKAVASPPPASAPKSWADLVRSKGQAGGAAATNTVSTGQTNGFKAPKSESLVDVLQSLGPDVSQYSDKVAFIEPRGLVNTGNMCYMNSVSRCDT